MRCNTSGDSLLNDEHNKVFFKVKTFFLTFFLTFFGMPILLQRS